MRPVIHVYTPCFNEALILPYFLRHYAFAERIFLFDNASTDATREIAAADPRVTCSHLETGGRFQEQALIDLRNHAWRASRGKADWVIVCDADEFLYHHDWDALFASLESLGATVVQAVGYDMFAKTFPPDYSRPLTEQVRLGVKSAGYNKQALFKPDALEEINYGPGSHTARPIGKVQLAQPADLKLLHYRHVGWEYVESRVAQHRNRLATEEIKKGWNRHLTFSPDFRRQWFDDVFASATDVFVQEGK